MFAVFLMPDLSGALNGFCKKSSVYLRLKRVTDGQTDGKAISIAKRSLRNAR